MKGNGVLLLVFLVLITALILTIIIFFFREPNYWKRIVCNIQPIPFNNIIYRPHAVYGAKATRVATISYSLYGNYEKYSVNLIKSLQAIPTFNTKWVPRVYVGGDIPKLLVEVLVNLGAEVYVMTSFKMKVSKDIHHHVEKSGITRCSGGNLYACKCVLHAPFGHEGAVWRFLPAAEQYPFLSLDADDMFEKKFADKLEKLLVDRRDFINFSRMKIGLPMMAGLWGGKNACIPDIQDRIDKYHETGFGFDEAFLKKEVWPILKSRGYKNCFHVPFVPGFFAVGLVVVILGAYLAAIALVT